MKRVLISVLLAAVCVSACGDSDDVGSAESTSVSATRTAALPAASTTSPLPTLSDVSASVEVDALGPSPAPIEPEEYSTYESQLPATQAPAAPQIASPPLEQSPPIEQAPPAYTPAPSPTRFTPDPNGPFARRVVVGASCSAGDAPGNAGGFVAYCGPDDNQDYPGNYVWTRTNEPYIY